ncbi:MAG: hypothetical protein ABI435_01190 [Pseudolysinimonas sp.]
MIRDIRHRRAVGVRELARLCGVAGSTVIDWERSESGGSIQVATLRRALAAMGERLVVGSRPQQMDIKPLERQEQRLGLELHRSIALKLIADPDAVLESAHSRLRRARDQVRGGAITWLDGWGDLISDRDLGGLVAVMLGTTQLDIDMRSVSPFVGLLSPEERREVLARASKAIV